MMKCLCQIALMGWMFDDFRAIVLILSTKYDNRTNGEELPQKLLDTSGQDTGNRTTRCDACAPGATLNQLTSQPGLSQGK